MKGNVDECHDLPTIFISAKKKKKKFKYSLRSMMIKILPESGTNWISGGKGT